MLPGLAVFPGEFREARDAAIRPAHPESGALLFDELHLEGDGDLVTDDDAAGLERGVPLHAEVRAADLRAGGRADAELAPRVLALGRDVRDLERDLARDAVNREPTLELEIFTALAGARRNEAHRRVVLDIEEVGAPEVGVALLLARVDGGHVDRNVDRGRLGARRIVARGAFELRELAAHVRDHQVPDGEPDVRVGGVDRPAGRREGDGGGSTTGLSEGGNG